MADIDLLTLDEANRAVAMTGNGVQYADQISLAVTAISRRVDAACGPVVAREVSEERYPTSNLVFLNDWISWGAFPNPAVQQVTELTEYVSGTGTVLTGETLTTSGGYLAINGTVGRRSGFSTTCWYGPFAVTYIAGRFADTKTVDPLFKTAAGAMLRRWWAREAPAWSRGGDQFGGEGQVGFFKVIDPVIDEFLSEERRPPGIA